MPVLFRYPDAAVAEAIRAVMAHLDKSSLSSARMTLDVVRADGGYRVFLSTRDSGVLRDPEAVASHVKLLLVDGLLERDPTSFALHGAALLSEGGAVLLVGSSGSGKSTLASVLNAGGWPAIADDVVFAHENRVTITGLAFAFAAKPGSWDVLARFFPGLERLRPRTRPDGRIVRCIPPTATADDPGGYAVRRIVLVRYTKHAGLPQAIPLRKADVVAALLSEAKNHAGRLSVRGFLALTNLVRGADCVELVFSDAAEAAALLLRDARGRSD
jgi:energy-coupling factor transporter ATP-binding protein EcfA2